METERWGNIERLYHAALERTPEERGKFLAEVCQSDTELLSELESLLAHELSATGPLDSPAWQGAASLLKDPGTVRLERGVHLGPYQIDRLIGAGGMGQVYKARDSRLGREVALKILGNGADGPGRRARFELEARAVAALNHPNIVSIFDFGDASDCLYAVSELIEGESLRSLLRHGPVSVRKLIDIAVQIADGLAAAHAAGIVHRDLKPENIMVSGDGRVKILDFGIARRFSPGSESPSQDASGLRAPMTEPGTVLGTPNYMSPEQARGASVDYHSDQFSLGLILYELATGKQAFAKPSTLETLAAILREEPEPIERKVPAPLRWAIDRCLAKQARERYESTRDLYEDLRSLRDHLSDAYASSDSQQSGAGEAKTSATWKILAIMGFAVSGLAIGAAALIASRNAGVDLAQYRYTPLAVDAKRQFSPVWSPNGKAIAYVASIDGEHHLFVRHIASPAATDLGIHRQFLRPLRWSADSRRIFFQATSPESTPQNPKQGVYSLSVIGGNPAFITDIPEDIAAAAISSDLRQAAIFCRCGGDKFSVFLSAPLGSPWRRYKPDPFSTTDSYNASGISFAPDGRKVFLFYTGESSESESWVLPLPPGNSLPRRVLTQISGRDVLSDGSWMPDSRHLLFRLWAQGDSSSHIWLGDTDSTEAYQVTADTSSGCSGNLSVSPDGRRIAFSKPDADLNVVSVSLVDNEVHTLVGTERNERMAAWAMRAPALAYVTDRNGPMEVWVRSSDGSNRPVVTQDNFPGSRTQFIMDPSLSPDGSRVVFSRMGADGATRNWIMSLADGVPQRLNESAIDTEFSGVWSPSGEYFAYLQESGKPKKSTTDLNIVTVGSAEPPTVLRADVSGSLPDWSPTGEWITFQDESGWNLISPKTKTVRPIGKIPSEHLAFSKDGKQLYGVSQDHSRVILFSLDVTTLKIKNLRELNEDLAPSSDYSPGIRLSVAPDGRSVTYAAAQLNVSIWLLEGFQHPSLLQRLFRRQSVE